MSIHKEPIAIVGIGCRFPGGASNPRQFWRNLCMGKDAIIDVPSDRWDIRRFYDPDPDKPGKSYVKQGGFLKEKVDHFDPLFFGISPREAESMDPQQRLLLEVAWEAFEDAGLVIEELAGSKTGVFIGGFCLDNLIMRVGPLNRELADTHTAASSTMTILANRISYVFDLTGPSVSMDTACSSSLVTTHYACQSLWNGESDMALAGGVNIMLRPEFPIAMSKGHFLSDHGRCMAFDERAAGYTRGEGAGIVVLKPLYSALNNNDHIYALIKMTGINQDGHTAGISMPNADAQAALMRSVYAQAGVTPGEIGYIEAHGTGTQAGDPKEALALDSVLSKDRVKGRKCLVGSVKTNIGHLEAGAGVAGLIKAALCIEQGKIPPSLHFNHPNPNIPFEQMCIQVATRVEDWPTAYQTRYAGVNSFGYGGTNAHVLLQQPPSPAAGEDRQTESRDRAWLLPVSGRSEAALAALAGKYAFHLTTHNDMQSVADFYYTATQRRSHHRNRLALLAENTDELRSKLQCFSTGDYVEGLVSGETEQQSGRLVFIYTGMGPQWWGMGRELMQKEPVFLETLRLCDSHFSKLAGWSIVEALQADEQNSSIARTEVAQPANFVIQVALTALFESWGIRPQAVIGHSVGEVSSAYASGALSLQDAIKVSYHRSRLQATTAGQGAMLAAGLTETDAIVQIDGFNEVSIAAINSPASVTLSGDDAQLQQIASRLQDMTVFNRFLQVEVAYHSNQMEPIRDQLLESLQGLTPRDNQVPIYSTVSGDLIDGNEMGADYWWHNVREPVRFAAGIQALLRSGFRDFIEIGPHPVLGHSVTEIASHENISISVIPSLIRKNPEHRQILQTLGQLFVQGHAINWENVTPRGGRFVSLPGYPWQRERYWQESQESIQDRLGRAGNIFLNNRISSPQQAWTVEINNQFFPFLEDHRVNEEIIFPGAAYIEAGLAVHSTVSDTETQCVADVQLHNLLLVEPHTPQLLGIVYQEKEKRFLVYSRVKDDLAEWMLHASGRLITEPVTTKKSSCDLASLRAQFTVEYPIVDLYAMLADRKLKYGPCFRNARQLWTYDQEFLVFIDAAESVACRTDDFLLHPVILDTALHSLLSLVPGDLPFVPVSMKRVTLLNTPSNPCWCHGIITEQTEKSLTADFYFYDEQGTLFAEIKHCFSRLLEYAAEGSQDLSNIYYEPSWEEYSGSTIPAEIKSCVLFNNNSKLGGAIETGLISRGIPCLTVIQGETFSTPSDNQYVINDQADNDYITLVRAIDFESISHIIYMWSLEPPDDADASCISTAVMKLIRLVKALDQVYRELNLVLVTRGAQVVTGRERHVNLSTCPLWGLAPLISNEYPNIHYQLIDIDPDQEIDDVAAYIDGETTDLAVRAGKKYVKQIKHCNMSSDSMESTTEVISTDEPIILHQLKQGQVDSLVYQLDERKSPGVDEVEIKVDYTGLNFKDVLKIYNSIPEQVTNQTYFGTTVGIEITGKIVRKGPNVKSFQAGDEVIAAARGSFRSYATVSTDFVWLRPKSIEPEQSLFYVSFSTAYHALHDLARLQPGEKILIHSATGALGMAAVQIARKSGAEIFATAGTEKKRVYLREIGIGNVYDSRSLSFAEEIMAITKGKGIDVVLNTLSGEYLRTSLSLLAPYGRFIEAGKTDIIENNGLPLALFNNNLSFSSIDFDRMHLERPEQVNRLVKLVIQGFEKGDFKPLPVTVFTANRTADAFRHMAQAKHIGKVAVKFADETVEITSIDRNSKYYHADGTYLIAGGTSGFGLAVAKWLASRNIGRLILASRRGAATQECTELLSSLQSQGINAEAIRLDITDETAVEGLINRIQKEGPRLRGIFNSAMVLDDAYIKDMDVERLNKVLLPKITGTLNLYKFTKDINLDYFISFSSISSLIGNPGQANYVAANSFLDEFARTVRLSGFPAITINWGVLAESGVVSRNAELNKILAQEGIKGLTNKVALEAMDRIIVRNSPQVGVFDIDWSQWAGKNPQVAKTNRFQALISNTAEMSELGIAAKALEVIDILEEKSETEQFEYIAGNLRLGMSKILKLSPDKIKYDQNLNKLGIDSLMLLELSQAIRDEYGIDISAMELFKQATIQQLANEIIRRLFVLRDKHSAN